ncbi:hypothetical protein TIFTF001_004013 [Ficus carica]|uniref:CBS domain-containing protein CBSCBSPB3 n=1 Tax=Ficus carica TaxID=3494 RepID=A0AA88CX22_FICCA|nr:hypothetical protein TIFTF001_004013 [Ficus carica]
MSGQVGPKRTSLTTKRAAVKKSSAPPPPDNGAATVNGFSKPSSPPAHSSVGGGERTVKKLRLSKALTIPEGTTVSDACRRMAARRVDAVLLTDSNALLSGIDIATRVIAEGLRPEQTIVSKVMTRNPIFVTADSLAIEALQKMVQGKFRHLPVVENGEVIALLDITKCLYDAISRMEKAAEQGSAIAAAVEGVERQWGNNFSAKKMRECRVNSVVVVTGNKIQGILTYYSFPRLPLNSKDILMRVVAQNISPELTLVEKVMTASPECASLETTILDALHIMHDGKFLHLPVLDKDGNVAACVDVLQISNAAISMVENSSDGVNDMANTMMQKFWDSALALEPPDDCDTHSEMSAFMTSDGTEIGKFNYPSLGLVNSFAFKFEDFKGPYGSCRGVFSYSGTENLDELLSTVMQRIGAESGSDQPQILYEDDEGDKVLLSTNSDLVAAVAHARSIGLKVLRLHLDYSDSNQQSIQQSGTATKQSTRWTTAYTGILASAVVVTGIGVLLYLKRTKL